MNSRAIYYAVWGKPAPRKSPRKPAGRGPARNWKYRAWIRTLPSAASGASGCEACHTGSDGGMRQKSSDYSCIPLTPEEHRELHRIGREDFERKYEISIARYVRSLQHAWFAYSKEVK